MQNFTANINLHIDMDRMKWMKMTKTINSLAYFVYQVYKALQQDCK